MDFIKLLNLVITQQKKDKCESNIFYWVRVFRHAKPHPTFFETICSCLFSHLRDEM